VEAELPIAVDNGVSFESVLSRMGRIEMNWHHVQKFSLHYTGETLPGEYYVWKRWLFVVRIIWKTWMHHVDKIHTFCFKDWPHVISTLEWVMYVCF
jgi:hypothetical protein